MAIGLGLGLGLGIGLGLGLGLGFGLGRTGGERRPEGGVATLQGGQQVAVVLRDELRLPERHGTIRGGTACGCHLWRGACCAVGWVDACAPPADAPAPLGRWVCVQAGGDMMRAMPSACMCMPAHLPVAEPPCVVVPLELDWEAAAGCKTDEGRRGGTLTLKLMAMAERL
eukprot:scaffold47370_cov60-Phaeocystis_antarctica.AAC.3